MASKNIDFQLKHCLFIFILEIIKEFKEFFDGLVSCFVGLKVTLPYLFARSRTITEVYPEPVARRDLPPRYRGFLKNRIDKCLGCRMCSNVCPVDCFYNHRDESLNKKVGRAAPRPGDIGMLVINPNECIHCGACEPECPSGAIFEDEDVPEKWIDYVELNARVTLAMGKEELEKNRETFKRA